jgi:hypothetical protein
MEKCNVDSAGESSVWQGYSLQPPVPQHSTSFESRNEPSPPHGQSTKGSYRSLNLPSIQPLPVLNTLDFVATTQPPSLNFDHSYESLKRSFQDSFEQSGEAGGDYYREQLPETPQSTINQDHRLLSFSRLPGKFTISDQYGRAQQIELLAQLHGMFFLSEMATPSGDGLLVQPELTCYRRNLFQISGTVTIPTARISLFTERGEHIPFVSLDVD